MNKTISGLIVKLIVGRSVYLTLATPAVIVAELKLISTSPKTQAATLAVTVSGEPCDASIRGLPYGMTTLVVSNVPMEVMPGVRIAIRGNQPPFVTKRKASVVIDASRDGWVIERDDVAERNIRGAAHQRRLLRS